MAQKVAADGRSEIEQRVTDAVEASDAIRRPVLDVSQKWDWENGDGRNRDPYRCKVECSGVDLLELHGDNFLTAYHRHKVEEVNHEDQATGVVVTIREHRE